MTTTLPVEPPPPVPSAAPLGRELAAARERLQQQRRRARNGLWIETVGVVAVLLVAYALPTFLTDRLLRLEWIYRFVLLASFAVVVVRVVRRRLMQPLEIRLSDEEMALAVERRSPELEQSLISSLQFDQELASGVRSIDSVAMKTAVVDQMRRRLASIPFARAIDAARVRRFAAGIVMALVVFIGWAGIDAQSLGIWASRNVFLTNTDWPRYTTLQFADTADVVRLPQGDALTVRVTVDGPVPDQLFLDYAFADGDQGSEPMSLTGEREFSWVLDAVLTDVTLTVQGGDALPIELAVTIVERPRIDDLTVRVQLPDYMDREPFDVPPTEGEVRLPRGAVLSLSGRSQKALQSAFLLFGNDEKTALEVVADGHGFAGDFRPQASGLLIVDVIDSDSLGAGTPPKLLLRVGEDKTPTLEFRLRGISSSITAHARIPGELKVRDDFGVREVGAQMRVSEDKPFDRNAEEAPLPPPPWVTAEPVFTAQLTPSAVRYETEASVDLLTWNKTLSESADNPIRPGMLFSLRYSAKDNFGPGEPHEGFGEAMTFRVITREQMSEELRRRQVEQRAALQAIADEEASSTLELAETVNPNEAGDNRQLAVARFKALARRQQVLGRRVRLVGEAYQRILWEFENNRVLEPNKVRQIESVIPAPLEVLAKDAFPATSRLVEAFTRTGDESIRQEAVDGYREIQRRLAAVLKEMEQAENLAALLGLLRNVIKLENDAIRDVRNRVQDRENDIFNPKKK